MNRSDIDWIERFYSDFERASGRKRPADYVERGLRVLNGKRKPCRNNTEGLTKLGVKE